MGTASLTISNPVLAGDGLSLSIPFAGESGSLATNPAVTGVTVNVNGLVVALASASVPSDAAYTAAQVVLATPVGPRAVVLVSVAPSSNLADGAGNTVALKQSNVQVSNQSFPVSPLWTYSEFLAHVGIKNVSQASNKDAAATSNKNSVNTLAVQMGFDFALGEITDRFGSSRFQVPLDFTPNGKVVPDVVKRWGFFLTMDDLYSGRGYNDPKGPQGRYQKLAQGAMVEMGFYISGGRDLPAAQAGAGNFHTPGTVSQADVLQARPGFNFIDGVPTWFPLL